jgi:integrase
VLPLGFRDLIRDLELHIAGDTRQPDEFLLYPKRDRFRPMDPASVHRWFKKCLAVAGLPATIEIHELRHTAADEIWRITGNIVLGQQLLRHESVATTQAYLHPSRDDLLAGIRQVDEAWTQVVRSDEP